jgi:GNAT superfamily N-acetyltransferase
MRVEVVDPERTRQLRRAVLHPNLAPDDPLPGVELADAVHIAALDDDGTVLGTCFIFPAPCPWRPNDRPSWRLRQMATKPSRRGSGLGAAMLQAPSTTSRLTTAARCGWRRGNGPCRCTPGTA